MGLSAALSRPPNEEQQHPLEAAAVNKFQKGTTHAANYPSDVSTCASISERCSGQPPAHPPDASTCTSISERCSWLDSPAACARDRLERRLSSETCTSESSRDAGSGGGAFDADAMQRWRERREARQQRKRENNKATYGDMAKACFMSNFAATMETIEEVLAQRGLPIINLEMLGKGTFARVHKGQWNRDDGSHGLSAGSEVAVKIIKQRHCLEVPTWLVREVSAGQRHAHRNLVSMYEAFIEAPPCVLVLEYCGGGSLHELLHNGEGEATLPKLGGAVARPAGTDVFTLAPRQCHKIALDVASGMAYLHAQCLVHRDLKPQNVLLAREVTDVSIEPLAKVGDFGLARFVQSGSDGGDKMTLEVGSVQYMAPEMFLVDGAGRGTYTEKVDVYSYSMLLFELLTKRFPFDSDPAARSGREDFRKIGLSIISGWRPKESIIPENAPGDLKYWMRHSWAEDPECRPGFKEVAAALSREL